MHTYHKTLVCIAPQSELMEGVDDDGSGELEFEEVRAGGGHSVIFFCVMYLFLH